MERFAKPRAVPAARSTQAPGMARSPGRHEPKIPGTTRPARGTRTLGSGRAAGREPANCDGRRCHAVSPSHRA